MGKNIIVDSPEGTNVIAQARSSRPGFKSTDSFFLDRLHEGICDCGVKSYQGFPIILQNCQLAPGREQETTEEYARVVDGKIIVHNNPVWEESFDPNWQLRVIDNKYPTFDERDIFSDTTYTLEAYHEGVLLQRDAKGKDIMVITSPHHTSPPENTDYSHILQLESIFIEKELAKDHVQYVHIGRNFVGLPRRKKEPISGNEYYTLEDGVVAGASLEHPHERIISMSIVPHVLLDSYRKVEEAASNNGKKWLYQELLDGGKLTIAEGKNFALLADPQPKHTGGLVVVAYKAQNITELNDDELNELGFMLRIGEQILNVMYDGPPLTTFFRQVFRKHKDEFPSYLMSVRLYPRDPRKNGVHATLEEGTHIYVITRSPESLAETARDLRKKYLTKE